MTSYLDLLPEEPIPLPQTGGFESIQEKGFCLKEYVCARCGAAFTLPWSAKGYSRTVRDVRLRFCSWKCLREDEASREMPKRGKPAAPVQRRRAELERKNAEDAALLEGGGLDERDVRRIKKRISERNGKLRRMEGNMEVEDDGE